MLAPEPSQDSEESLQDQCASRVAAENWNREAIEYLRCALRRNDAYFEFWTSVQVRSPLKNESKRHLALIYKTEMH